MSPARLVGLLIAGAAVLVLGVNFVLAVKPAVDREKESLLDEACVVLEPTARNVKLGDMTRAVAAPDIQAQDHDGKPRALSQYRGKVVLLNFWASWCPPCVQEMPSMEKLQREFGNDLVIFAISADKSWDDIKRFFPGGSAMTILWDPSAGGGGSDTRVGELSRSWGSNQLPDSYLIDRQGRIRYFIQNTRDWSSPDAKRCLRKLLDE